MFNQEAKANNKRRREAALRNEDLIPYGYLVVPHPDTACPAAKAIERVAMRIRSMPVIPLRGCSENCTCMVINCTAQHLRRERIAVPD